MLSCELAGVDYFPYLDRNAQVQNHDHRFRFRFTDGARFSLTLPVDARNAPGGLVKVHAHGHEALVHLLTAMLEAAKQAHHRMGGPDPGGTPAT